MGQVGKAEVGRYAVVCSTTGGMALTKHTSKYRQHHEPFPVLPQYQKILVTPTDAKYKTKKLAH